MEKQITYNRKEKSYIVDRGSGFPTKRLARIARLRREGTEELADRVELLLTLYPVLRDRAITAGEMVCDGRVYPSNEGELVGEIITGRAAIPVRSVRFIREHFTCTCEDFEFNVKAIPVANGTCQMLCPHILAVILQGWERWGAVVAGERAG